MNSDDTALLVVDDVNEVENIIKDLWKEHKKGE
jgi:hypothetical protein